MTVKNVVIHAQKREDSSSGFVRKLRKSGVIPGVLYHKGQAEKIAIPAVNLPKEHPRACPVKLVIDGVEKSVLMREVQVDPLTDKPIHFDFQEVSPKDRVSVSVPLNFKGLSREQEKEGVFNIIVRYLEIKTLLSELPAVIDVDVSGLKIDGSISVRDLNLPKHLVVRSGNGKNIALASLVKI